jgi:hypothetical protein
MKKPATSIILVSLLSAAGAALTVTAFKNRHKDSGTSNDTETQESKKAVAIAKVLEGNWQARIALAWKLIKEERTNEVNELICLETLEAKEGKQHNQVHTNVNFINRSKGYDTPYVRKSKEADQIGSFNGDDGPEEESPTQYNYALRTKWTEDGFQQTQLDME